MTIPLQICRYFEKCHCSGVFRNMRIIVVFFDYTRISVAYIKLTLRKKGGVYITKSIAEIQNVD